MSPIAGSHRRDCLHGNVVVRRHKAMTVTRTIVARSRSEAEDSATVVVTVSEKHDGQGKEP
jgi:hypothetical protein